MNKITNQEKIKKVILAVKAWFGSDRPIIEHYNNDAFKFYTWSSLIKYYPEFKEEILKTSSEDFYITNKYNLYLTTEELFDLLYEMNLTNDMKFIDIYIKAFIRKNKECGKVYELAHMF